MQIEYELKFLDIDPLGLRQKLKAAGAELLQPERLMRVRVFDYPDFRLDRGKQAWLRLRDEGDKVTLIYKQFAAEAVDGMTEIGLVVDSFDQTTELLQELGLIEKSNQEKKRETWQLNGCLVELDTWPWAPTFVEFDGPSKEAVHETAAKLGFSITDGIHGGVWSVYRRYFDIPREAIDYAPSLLFAKKPDWVEQTKLVR